MSIDIYKERIKPLLDKAGKTDRFLEDAIGLPRGIIYKWENGKNKNFKFYITEIASYFHVSTDYLLGNTDDPTPAGQKRAPPAEPEAEDPNIKVLLDLARKMSEAELALLTERAERIIESRG